MQLQNVDVIVRFRTRSKREGFVGRGVKVVQAPAQERVLHNGEKPKRRICRPVNGQHFTR